MRVYEVAKKFGVSNKELLDLLRAKGYDVPSHMSALPQDVLDFVTNHFKKPAEIRSEKVTPIQKETPKETVPAQQKIVQPVVKPQQPQPQKAYIPPQSNPAPRQEKPVLTPLQTGPESFVLEAMTLGDAATKMHKSASELILVLLKQGIVCTKNQVLTPEVLIKLAEAFQIKTIQPAAKKEEALKTGVEKNIGTQERLPVVVIIGHVDHGKTTLLDFIRKTRVAAKEKGGITQHLGAYEAKTPQGSVVFLDTPGHAAFTKMRARGLKAADIAILVVAADDSVMPQTVEAIKQAKVLEIPLIVAINKVDKVEPTQLERVRRDLAQHDVLPEDWGGQTIMVPISAKTGLGIDRLLEMIILQSQVMDLRADLQRPAVGFVLESKLEKGRGPVATVISQHGVLRVGDYFSAGNTQGRISSLVDSYGKQVKEVAPSIPVQVAGFSELPDAGDVFEIISKEQYQQAKTAPKIQQKASLTKAHSDEAVFNIMVKVDSNSTKEALLGAIEKVAQKIKRDIHIVHSAVGDIAESDVMLAANTGSVVYGLHIKVEPNAVALAQRNKVDIKLYSIIYKLLEELELFAKPAEKVKYVTKKIGEANVLKVFDIKDLGVIAGAYLKEGRFARDGFVKVFRGRDKVGEGKIKSLQRDRKAVKEVHTGFEFAFMIDGFDGWKVDDRVECYLEVPEAA